MVLKNIVLALFCVVLLYISSIECSFECYKNETAFTVDQVVYSSGLKPFYNLAVKFIDAVHGTISNDQIQSLIDYFENLGSFQWPQFWQVIKPIFIAEIGYIILLVLGVAFLVLMPLIGLLFCCCRCCDNCGGKRYQEKPSCGCCVFLLVMSLVCFAFMLAGVALYAVNNKTAYQNVETFTPALLQQADYVTQFLNDTSNQFILSTANGFNVAAKGVTDQLGDLGQRTINETLTASGVLTLRQIQDNSDLILLEVPKITSGYQTVIQNATQLNNLLNNFTYNYNNLGPTNPINSTIVTSEMLFYNENSTTVLNINTNFLNYGNFTTLSQNAFNNILRLGNEVQSTVDPILGQITTDNNSAQALASSFQTIINNLLTNVTNITNQINKTSTDVLQNSVMTNYKWVEYVSLVIVLPVLIVCILTFLGLCCGMFGHNGKAKPYQRGCCSNCGGNTLMGSVVTMFLFSWILMLICICVFFFGFGAQGFICEPVFEDANIRGLSLVPNITIATTNGSAWVFSVQESLLNCKDDMALYTALSLGNVINLNQSIFQPISLTLKDIYNTVISYSNKVNFNQMVVGSDLPSSAIFQQLYTNLTGLKNQLTDANNVLSVQPEYTMDSIESAITSLQGNGTLRSLYDTAVNLNQSLNGLSTLITSLDKLNEEALKQTSDSAVLISTVVLYNNAIQSNFNNASYTAQVVNAFWSETFNNSANYLIEFTEFLSQSIYKCIGKCRPLYDVFENVGVITCQQLLYPLQGWWLALGWCLIFFIPAICFNVRLAKYFRTMDRQYYKDETRTRWSVDALRMTENGHGNPPIDKRAQPKPGMRRMY